jgi:hypothetical protein
MLRLSMLTLAAALTAAAITACGGGSAARAGGGAASSAPTVDAPQTAALMAHTFGANPKAASGKISGTVKISVNGVPHFGQPISFSTSGPFSDAGGASLSSWDQSLELDAHGLVFGAGLTSSADGVYFSVGTTAYRIPPDVVAQIREASGTAHNGLGRTLAPFSIRPDLWTRHPRIVGDEQLAGVKVVHVASGVHVARFFHDASRFAHLLSSLHITAVAGLPAAVSRAAQAALVRSVTAAHGDLYTGAADHVMRRANLAITLAVAAPDRKLLGGMRSATITAQIDVTEVGAPQTIKVLPDHHLPYSLAVGLLGAAAFSNRPAGQRGN